MKCRISYEQAGGDLSMMDPKSRRRYKQAQKKILDDIFKEAERVTEKEISELGGDDDGE